MQLLIALGYVYVCYHHKRLGTTTVCGAGNCRWVGRGWGQEAITDRLRVSGNAFGSSAYVLFAPSSQPLNENHEGQKMKAWPQSVMGNCRSARVGTDTTSGCDKEKKSSSHLSRTSRIQRTTTTDHCIYECECPEEKAQLRTGNNLDFGTSTLHLASESCSSARSLHKYCCSTAGKYASCAFDAAGDDIPNPWLGLSVGGPHTKRDTRNGFANLATTSCDRQRTPCTTSKATQGACATYRWKSTALLPGRMAFQDVAHEVWPLVLVTSSNSLRGRVKTKLVWGG